MIDAACIAFHKSVSAFITKSHKRNRHRPREHGDDYDDDGRGDGDDTNANDVDDNAAKCIELVEHANHVLRTLFAKRLSLQNAIVAFREASELYVQQFGAATTTCTSIESEVNNNAIRQEDDRQRQRILRNWFANYIRLRDGFVLLESGERRHPHDGDNNFNRFTSKLKGAYRSDGITRKFSSSNGYTGTGYDEVYDEDVGIKRRLLEALSDIDCHGGRKRRSVASINDKLFDGDNYGNGAQLWEGCMDEHIRDSKVLRDTLNSIQVKFVNDINNHLLTIGESDRGGGGPARAASVKKKKMKLNLVTDDKFERMTLGDIVDIARQGNAFTLQDAGGSLPIGMTVQDWRQRFGVIPTAVTAAAQSTASTKVEKVTVKKKRKVILEDSSEEEEDDKEADNTTASCKTNKSATTKQLRMAPEISSDPAVASSQKRTIATTDNDDGLTVRMRKATDVSNDSCNGRISAGETYVNTAMEDYTSIDEMKRKLGVNNAQLERGRELLENEQLLSRIAADEEDMREEILLRDGNTTTANHHHGNHIFAAHANLLRKIYASRNDLRKKNVLSYNTSDDIELLRESQEYWAAFDDSVLRWNDQLQSFGVMRKEVSDGILDESSDRVRASIFETTI